MATAWLIAGLSPIQASQTWDGPSLTFFIDNFSDTTQPQNQDRLTPNVWLTADQNGLFNAAVESTFNFNTYASPVDTEWASGTTADLPNLYFQPWMFWTWNFGDPGSTVGQNAVLHLIRDDIYIDIQFQWWSWGGGFSYVRSSAWLQTTMNGSKDQIVLVHVPYNDPGASAQDYRGNPLTVSTNSTLDIETPGTYTITYSASDEDGHTDQKSRTVTVLAEPPPMFLALMPSFSQQATYANAALNQPIEIWGRAWGGIGPFNYTLDFGDGQLETGTNIAATQMAFYVGSPHTYSSSGSKTVTLSVTDTESGITMSGQALVRVVASPTFDNRVNMAIEKGKLLLYKTYTTWDTNRIYWLNVSGNDGVGTTAFSLLAFEENGHLPGNDYQQDIYAELVQNGLNTLASIAVSKSMDGRGELDSNGDGIAVNIANDTYADCLSANAFIMGFTSTNAASNALIPEGLGPFAGTSYYTFVVNMIDALYGSQHEDGAWHYSVDPTAPDSGADGSTHQWPNIVLLTASERWGLPLLSNVVAKSVASFQSLQASDGGCGYDSAGSWENEGKTGGMLAGYTLRGKFPGDTNVDLGLSFLGANWNNDPLPYSTGGGWAGDFYAMYGVKKGLQLQNITSISAPDGQHDWYLDMSSWLLGDATLLGVNVGPDYRSLDNGFGQNSDGSWTGSQGFISTSSQSAAITTADAILVLTKAVTKPLPVAVVAAIPDQSSRHPAAITLDGRGSYHLDPNSSIIEYLWVLSSGTNSPDWSHPDATGKIASVNPGWTNVGTYTVTLRVKDNAVPPNYAMANTKVNVVETDVAPVALAIPPDHQPPIYTAKIGDTVLLDGSASYDPDGDPITAYAWDLNGDGIYGDAADAALDTSGNGATNVTASVVFTSTYNGQIGLQITANGKTSSNNTSVDVYVSPSNLFVNSLSAFNAIAGVSVDVHAVLTNAPDSGQGFNNVLVRFFNGDPLTTGAQIGTNYTVNLPIGGGLPIDTTLPIPGLTNFTLFVYLDANNAIPEYAENDNLASVSVVGAVESHNHAPVAAVTIPDQSATVGDLLSFSFDSGTFTDPDGGMLTYTASGLPSGIDFDSDTRSFSGTPTNAGSYLVTVIASDGQMPPLTASNTFTITVAKAAATVVLSGLNQTYDGAAHAVSADTTPAGLTVQLTYNGSSTPPLNSGNYSVIAAISDPAYSGGVTNTLFINKATLTIASQNAWRCYGQTNPQFTADYIGFVNGENVGVLNGTPVLGTSADTNSLVGRYHITVTPGDISAANYSFNFVAGSLTVTQAVLTVTAVHQSRVYGETNPVLSVSYAGFVNGDTTNVLSGEPELTTVADISSPVGAYPITAGPGTLSATNYSFSFAEGTLSIGKALLTIAAEAKSRVYGAANPLLTASYSGFIEGDTAAVLSGAPTLSTLAETNSPVGPYEITVAAGTLTATNYALVFTNGVLSVTPATLSLTADNQTKVYGETNPPLTGSLNGVLNGDSLSASFSTVGDVSSSVGLYDILSSINDPSNQLSNYTVTTNNGTLTITPAALVVSVENQTRTYGTANPALTGSLVGVTNGDLISASFATVATAASPAGSYDIIPVFTDSSEKLGNYAITTNLGTLTVTKAFLTARADDQSRAYGAPNPVLTFSYGGFVNGESARVMSGQPDLSTSADTQSAVGDYAIHISPGTLSAVNYSVSLQPGLLTVTQAVVTVIAQNQSRLYGMTNPPLTASYSGFVNGDTTNVLTGAAMLTTAADIGSPVGAYPITAGPGTLSATNYSFSFAEGTLSIGKALLTIAAEAKSRVYGAVNPLLTASYSGFIEGDTAEVLSGAPTLTTLAETNSPVGPYEITVAAGTLTATNYALVFTNGVLSVTPATLSLTADNQTKVYGQTNPPLTGSLNGVLNGDSLSASFSTVGDVSSSVGLYDILSSINDPSNQLSNYTVTTNNGTLTITPAALVVSVENQTRTYGTANPALTGSLVGVTNGDLISASFATVATAASPVGSYDLIPVFTDSSEKLGNYAITTNLGTLTVTKAFLTARADDQSRAYGAPNPAFTGTIVGLLNNDPIGVTFSSLADPGSPAGNYSIVPSLDDPAGASSNYAVSKFNGTLTVTAALTLTSNPLFYVIHNDPMLVDTNATIADGGSLNFAGGTLQATIVTNASAQDELSVQSQGIDAGQIGVLETNVTFGGVSFASFSGGSGTNGLLFSFNGNATAAALSALLRHLAFATTATNPPTRDLQMTLTYGNITLTADRLIEVELPLVAGNSIFEVSQGVTVSIPFSLVLSNAFDPNGDPLTVVDSSRLSTNGGQITLTSTNFIYVPPAVPTNQDFFAYLIGDGKGSRAIGMIELLFKPRNVLGLNASGVHDTGARLNMMGTPGQVYQILVSTDLLHWTLLSTVTAAPTGLIEILDTDSKVYAHRFYRALAQ